MTTPRKPKHRTPSAKREDTSRLRPDVVAAIERAWPDGVIEMSFDTEESWFCGILEKHGVTVLPETEWRKEVPWLRSDGDALVGDAVYQPVRVLDALFFEGV